MNLIHLAQEQPDVVERTLDGVISPRSQDLFGLRVLGLAKRMLGKHNEAIDLFLHAIQLDPRDSETHVQIALAYRSLRKLDSAIMYMLRAVDRSPTAQNFTNCGKLYVESKSISTAVGYFKKALAIDPDFTAAHYELSLAYALEGRWEEFFKEYEWRARYFDDIADLHNSYPMPHWDGSPIAGKRLLIHGEQGHGDWIQFVRYVELIKNESIEVALHCPKSLMRLFSRVAEVYDASEYPPPADYHCSVMSLPFLLEKLRPARNEDEQAAPAGEPLT